ncbi:MULTISPECIES: Holliday junction branch migration protein RuvA [unclassified Helicobacter]|uniref:Holliday junction branch migration protein RuvA n=1 Tax=unclassified Helicobacter TaxID=2593540 RepID=UPI000CF0E7AD|nr:MULTISPECIES: Holliday junction branch migration protein RuvA [unclassified Helicobacter]
MLFAIKGRIFSIEPTRLLLEQSGLIYEIFISFTTFNQLNTKQEVLVFVTKIIREDSHALYGFSEEVEKNIFDRLIKINGVGPKVALAILSTYNPQEFLMIIQNKDIASLQKVSGIGAKSAGKIMVDLSGFYIQTHEEKAPQKSNIEAKMALESLGFKPSVVDKVLKQVKAVKTQDIIKEALGLLR